MRITYRTLAGLIGRMSQEQLDCDVTVEIPGESSVECCCAELRIAGAEHDGGLDEDHPVIFVGAGHVHNRRDDMSQIAIDIGLG